MTEEQHREQCEYVCISKGFKNFLTITCGSFIGVFFALCLFGAIHTPPMPPCPTYGMPMYHHECHCRDHHADFHKMPGKEFKKHQKYDRD